LIAVAVLAIGVAGGGIAAAIKQSNAQKIWGCIVSGSDRPWSRFGHAEFAVLLASDDAEEKELAEKLIRACRSLVREVSR